MGLLVWTVFCLGIGLVLGAGAPTATLGSPLPTGLGVACFLWALGMGVWMLVGAIL